jgi:hypothetical protein
MLSKLPTIATEDSYLRQLFTGLSQLEIVHVMWHYTKHHSNSDAAPIGIRDWDLRRNMSFS